MSGELDTGDAETPRPRIGLFGRASKPASGGPAPPAQPPRIGLFSVSGLLTFVLLGALATVGALAWLLKQARSPGPLAADKVVMIVREDRGIADQLERAGVIDSAQWFNALTLLDGNRGALKRGEYAFKAGMSMNDIENELVAHRVVRYKLSIPEGLTSEQIVDRLRDDPVLIGDIKEPPREGSLMPDTYYFERGDTQLSILARMAKAQTKAIEEVWKGRATNLPIKSQGQMVTLASIVEKETGKADERPRVAGVFVNRLERRMRLESDPTIVYGLALGKGTLGRGITKANLNQSTPYNTYIIDGLPPGPICNPGRAALEAVANPAHPRDLYLVADGTGGHVFAETLDQHQKNVVHSRQIEKDVKDKLAPDVALQQASIDPIDPSQFGALDRKLERALVQQIIEDRANPQPIPDPAEQQGSADPSGGDRQRAFVLVERMDQQHLIGELRARGDERSERAGGGQLVGAAEIGDHPLADGRAVAPVLDDLYVAALAGLLEAEEHGPLMNRAPRNPTRSQISSAKTVQT